MNFQLPYRGAGAVEIGKYLAKSALPSDNGAPTLPLNPWPDLTAGPNPEPDHPAMKGRIFSGVQPTHTLHLGNYLGAVRNWVRMQKEYECIFCVVDLHAITQWQDPKELTHNIREVTAAFMASGIDVEHGIIFAQSQVRAHAQLAWILNCVARVGWLNRMTQFKEKAGKDRENASVGLYTYPVLMAADILGYRATHVPVGEDQKQHLELARDIAQKFNTDFGVDMFPPMPSWRGCSIASQGLAG